MEVESSGKDQQKPKPLTPAEQAHQMARGMVERSSHLLRNGVGEVLVLIWEWLWTEAGFRPGTITIKVKDLADERGDKSRQATMDNLTALKDLEICPIVAGKRGRGGGTVIAVEDPFDVYTDHPRRVEVPDQNDLPFVAELETIARVEEEQRISAEAPDVVAIGTPVVKCNPEDALGYIKLPEPKCNPEADQGYICEVERGDHASLPALFVEQVARELGDQNSDLWLGGCRYEWHSPELKLFCANEYNASYVRKNYGSVFRWAGQSLSENFKLQIHVEPDPTSLQNPNVTLWPLRVTLSESQNVTQTAQGELLNNKLKLTKQTNKQDFLLEEKARFIIQRAEEIYARLDDRTLFPWYGIMLAMRLDTGNLSESQVDDLVEVFIDNGHQPKRCFELAGIEYWKLGQVKLTFKKRYGKKAWNPRWMDAPEKRKCK